MTTKKQMKIDDRNASIQHLLDVLKPGDTVHTILKHVSRSGMMRHISTVICNNGEITDITWHVARAMDEKRADNGGIKQGGCGMDMGFNLVYNLGYTLWPKGTKRPHGTRNGVPDSNGGYALNQQWL